MRRGDWAWPLGIWSVGVLELVALSRGAGAVDAHLISGTSAAAGMVLEAGACGLLVLRRRWPVAVALAVSVVGALLPAIGIHMDEPATPILILGLAMFAAGRHRAGSWAYAAPVGGTLAPFVSEWLDDRGQVDVTDALFIACILGAPFAFGRLARRQALAHAREQERVRREATATERVRIARELHDVMAHTISRMVMRASVAADGNPHEPSALAFSQIADTGREALADVGLMLRLLRAPDTQDSPNPTEADLPALVDRLRRAGLMVEPADLALGPAPLSSPLGLSVYRVVQEALTNSLKHAPMGPTRLHVEDGEDGIYIEVTSPHSGARAPWHPSSAGAGHGLIGMRERVEMFGGTLHAGPCADGGFQVRALLPPEVTA